MSDIINMCQVLNSYFLHEISSPLSAISSTTDLFNSSQAKIKKEAFNIISDGSHILCNKVKFYSYAYSVSSTKQNITISIIKKLCEGMLIKTKIDILCKKEIINYQLADDLGKIVMCLIITAYKNLCKEGQINIEIKNNNVHITVRGNLMQLSNNKLQILTGEFVNTRPDVYNCNEYYTRLLADKNKYKIIVKQLSNMIEYVVSQ